MIMDLFTGRVRYLSNYDGQRFVQSFEDILFLVQWQLRKAPREDLWLCIEVDEE